MTDRIREAVLVAMLLAVTVSCAALAALDPVTPPPEEYRKGGRFTVEFLAPEAVWTRCMSRGALYPANACADRSLVTMMNPCAFEEPYARILCHELAHAHGWRE